MRKNMSVILYTADDDNRECRHLEAVLEPVVPKQLLEVITKFEDLSGRIRRLPRDIDVAILSVQDDYQLTALLSLADYLDSIWIILILPHRDHGMMSRGHLLHPRFVAFRGGDYSDITAVLSKNLQNKSWSRYLP
jgi:hypothetical protein